MRLSPGRLESIVEEVEQHIAAGKPDSAALVLGVCIGKVEGFSASYVGLQGRLLDEGASPEGALGRG